MDFFALTNLYLNLELTQPDYGGAKMAEAAWCANAEPCRGPLADLRIGMQVEYDRFTLRYGVKHVSHLLDPRDRGYNGPFINFEWRPYAR